MKMDPYKIDPSRSPLLPNSGYRMSGLFMTGWPGRCKVLTSAWKGLGERKLIRAGAFCGVMGIRDS